MINEIRVFDGAGRLKKVIPQKKATALFWDSCEEDGLSPFVKINRRKKMKLKMDLKKKRFNPHVNLKKRASYEDED